MNKDEDPKDESFFDLMNRFSKLDLTKEDDTSVKKGEENICPVCEKNVGDLHQFVIHVYECVKKFDTNIECEGDDVVEQEEISKHFKPPEYCPQGVSCTRQDRGHFQNVAHPLITCPCCQSNFEIYKIHDHFITCSDSSSTLSSSSSSSSSSSAAVTSEEQKLQLTRGQMIAISSAVLSVDDENSVNEMLETFGKLGFTKENLKKEIEK
jgi:hypothetical protein